MEKKEKKTKLSLCDGCVLVGIITLLTFVTHPAITQAMEERKLSDMVQYLQQIRSHIRVYKADTGLYPGQERIGDLSVTSEDFVGALTESQASRRKPYLQSFPANPYCGDPDMADKVTCLGKPDAHPAGTEQTGWWFNVATGEFYACDSEFHANY